KPAFSRPPLNFSIASWAPSLMPSPSAAWPPLSGLWVAILRVPLLPCAFVAAGSATRASTARRASVRRTGLRIIGAPPSRSGRRGEHRADRDVAGAVVARLAGLREIVGRPAEDHPRLQQGARGARRQVVLAQVDAVRRERQSQVHAVVHDEGRARPPAALAQPLGERQETAGLPLVLPGLDY